MNDARFEDAAERPLRLWAQDLRDLQVISALVQDAVLTGADMTRRSGRFALLVNRFRWEETGKPHAPERVRAVVSFGDVRAVRHQGALRGEGAVLSLLAIAFTPDMPPEDPEGAAGPGRVRLTFAGDGLVELSVDGLDVTLADVTRPFRAPSGKVPSHER
jgi:hypothetical protein